MKPSNRSRNAVQSQIGRWNGAPSAVIAGSTRVLNVPQDPYDLKDRQYMPTLRVLPVSVDHRERIDTGVIRDQGDEGACVGFAMAAVVNHLAAARGEAFDASPRFLYEQARRYDEWKGEDYEGSSIRGAMKGFMKHGACRWDSLPYVAGEGPPAIPAEVFKDASQRPLGAYYRVSTSSINDMQCAILETGAVLASANVHDGWDAPKRMGGTLPRVVWKAGLANLGGHAFTLVGYDEHGFIIQNSWGTGWGDGGFAIISYEDWFANRMDAWVCQLGIGSVHVQVTESAFGTISASERQVNEEEIRNHYLAVRNGHFDDHAPYRSSPADLTEIANSIIEFAKSSKLKSPPVMLWAHGGLVSETSAAARTRDLLDQFRNGPGIYPLSFIWHTDLMETVGDLLLGKSRHVSPTSGVDRAKGWAKDKVIEAMDNTLEMLLGPIGGPIWREMKGDAAEACHGPGVEDQVADAEAVAGIGPAFLLLDKVHEMATNAKVDVSWHMVGHSAGSILHCRLLRWFVTRNIPIASVSFIAPAVSCTLFERTVMKTGLIKQFDLHTMPDEDEREDVCAKVYHKSLLYLVSESFERKQTAQLLGLARHIDRDFRGDSKDVYGPVASWLTQPNVKVRFARPASYGGTLHGDFDEDPKTLELIRKRILGMSK